MNINIVLLVHNRPVLTKQCLESLIKNTRNEFSLTIVDDVSDTKTKLFLEEWAEAHTGINRFVLHNETQLGVGGSRNAGLAESERSFGRGEFIYFSDNDAFFTPGWDDTIIAALMTHPEFKVIGGQCHPFQQANGFTRAQLVWRSGTLSNYRISEHNALDGLSWMLAWNTWEQYGQFLADGKGCCQSEDWEYSQRIRNDGFKVGCVNPHVVLNCGKTNSEGKLIPGYDIACHEAESLGVIVE